MDAREAAIRAVAPNIIAQFDNCFPLWRVPSRKHVFDGIIDGECRAKLLALLLPRPQ